MTMETPPFEDVFPMKNGDFPMSCYLPLDPKTMKNEGFTPQIMGVITPKYAGFADFLYGFRVGKYTKLVPWILPHLRFESMG